MKGIRLLLIAAVALACLSPHLLAAGGKYPWSDSLATTTLADTPSLQDVLTSLGYAINVTTDELSQAVIPVNAGADALQLTLKYKGTSSNANCGWYADGAPGALNQVFAAFDAAGTTVNMAVPAAAALGFYVGPTLYDDTWYTQTNLNWDNFQHARIFATGEAGKYVITWEDLADGGDQDYNDIIVEVYFIEAGALSLSFEGETSYLFCNETDICFTVNALGGSGTLVLEQKVGGSYQQVATGVGSISHQYCFLPWPVDSLHQFIFRVTDDSQSIEDTFSVDVQFRENPELYLDADFIDTTICEIDSICVDVATAFDYDGDELKFTLYDSPPARIDSTTGEICFLPADLDSAVYQFIIVAYDSCCASYGFPADPDERLPCPRDTLLVQVKLNKAPVITTIPDATETICQPGPKQLCFPVSATTPNETPVPVMMDCGIGTISNGQLCFTADTSGTYQFCFYAEDACGGVVRDTVLYTVIFSTNPPVADAGLDQNLTLCAPQEICWPAGCSDPDGDLESCTMASDAPNATYDGSQICFTPLESRQYQFIITATDGCGNVDADTAYIMIDLNSPPVANIRDTSIALCGATQVCLEASCDDPDGDLTSCGLVGGSGTYNGEFVCFTPDTAGVYRFILRAKDSCNQTDFDTAYATIELADPPVVQAGGGNFTLCEPDSICVPVNIVSSGSGSLVITSTMGVVHGTNVCIYSGVPGTRQFNYNVIVKDACGLADTALYTVNVTVNQPPQITVPTPEPEVLCDATQLCFDVDATDALIQKLVFDLVSGPGTINEATGEVCFTPTESGEYHWKVVVRDSCQLADTGDVSWTVDFVEPAPGVELPANANELFCLGDDVSGLCIDFSYDDEQVNALGAELIDASTDYSLNYAGGSGQLCFDAFPDMNRTYTFRFFTTNDCSDSTFSEFAYSISFDDCDSACIVVEIEETQCYNLGSNAVVDINYQGSVGIGGYDLLIKYDVSAFSFISANIGADINGWEYFTYRLGPFSNCSGSCPDGLVRLTAIADANNGANHPPVSQLTPSGVIGQLRLRVTSDNNFEGRTYPVSFYWLDCGDNAFSTISGDTLLVDRVIYSDQGAIIWDERDNDNYPEASRYPNTGAPDECLLGDKFVPIRCVDIHNGNICIIDNDSIDARGDLNLNGISHEIGDAVLYTNYFLVGISAFKLSIPAQTAASDVNADGLTLTVGDLIYLLRVLVGDAQPFPKLAPFANSVDLTLQSTETGSLLRSESSADLGGIALKVRFDGATPPTPYLADDAQDLEMQWHVDGNMLNIVIYSDRSGARVASGEAQLVTFDAPVEIVSVEASDYFGAMLETSVEKSVLPTAFELAQNYPNPFNPSTTIRFSLPEASNWDLVIYNVSGQLVRHYTGTSIGYVDVTWDATDRAGLPVASGVYFYRLSAGDFTATRKMLLMK